MLIGYVSDEDYQALPGTRVELVGPDGRRDAVRATARGAVYADVEPGEYEVTLSKPGFGAKTVTASVAPNRVRQFRLLSEDLLGYAWPKWIEAGEVGEYRVHAPEETRISLWRYGAEKELVEVVAWHYDHGPRAGAQRLPDGDFTQTGVGWLKHRHGFVEEVEAPQRSGLYYFHMEGDSGGFFSFPWIVMPRRPSAPVAVLASTNTWNAYNSFGGRSNYVNVTSLPDAPVVHPRDSLDIHTLEDEAMGAGIWSRANHEYEPLSFERPCRFASMPPDASLEDPIEGKEQAHTVQADWRLLGWLEREGFAYDLYPDAALHGGRLDLDAYDVLVLDAHPEYWSARMYERVGDWVRDRGGRVVSLGGNAINAEVELLDGDRLRVLNDMTDVAMDARLPTEAPEGSYESRFHRTVESEGNLLGIVTTESGMGDGSPYEVLEPDHWAFAGTGLEAGDRFGGASLVEYDSGGASGMETDKRSRFAPDDLSVIAKGTNEDEGGAELVHYETDNGGTVVAVGSLSWVASLPVDARLSAVTANVIDRFVGA